MSEDKPREFHWAPEDMLFELASECLLKAEIYGAAALVVSYSAYSNAVDVGTKLRKRWIAERQRVDRLVEALKEIINKSMNASISTIASEALAEANKEED